MKAPLGLSAVHLTPARPADVARGLIGFLRVELGNGLVLDGLTVRRTRRGEWRLSFPAKDDREGRRHFFVRPLSDMARLRFERTVFEAIAPELALLVGVPGVDARQAHGGPEAGP